MDGDPGVAASRGTEGGFLLPGPRQLGRWDAWGQGSLTCPGANLLSGSEVAASHAFLGPLFLCPTLRGA